MTDRCSPLARACSAGLRALLAIAVFAVVLIGGLPHRTEARVSAAELAVGPEVLRAGEAAEVEDVGTDAEMVGFTWTDDTTAAIEVRALVGETWTEWLELEGSPGEQPDSTSAEGMPGLVSAGPAWLGDDFRRIQLRVHAGTVRDLRLTAIDSESASGPPPLAIPGAGAVPTWPYDVIPRSGWGADESYRNLGNPGCDGQPKYATELRFAVVHHTVNANTYAPSDSAALIRGIYYFHTHTNQWCDIGYHFLVDRFGQVFEGRAGGIHRTTIGGHAGGFNTGSTGVAMLGDFSESPPPAAAMGALRRLLTWKLAYHGIDPLGTTTEVSGGGSARWPAGTVVTLPTLGGHRDSNTTGCPGQYLYDLIPQLRRDVAAAIAASPVEQRLTCDWDGDGDETQAFFANGTWYIRNSTGEAYPDLTFAYGTGAYTAICGDWDGNGTDTVGVFVDGWFYLRNSNSPGPPNIAVNYGMRGYVPVVGDWDGNRTDTIGVFVDGGWYLRDTNSPGPATRTANYGTRGYVPVVGDWNGDGRDGIGVFVAGGWYVRNDTSGGPPHISVAAYGKARDVPIAGDWDRDGKDSFGVARGAYWFLSPIPQASGTNVIFPF